MSVEGSAPLTLLVRLLPSDFELGGIHLEITSATEGRQLSADGADLVLRVWWETAEIVRASITNVRSGKVAMVQGNVALRRLAEEIGLAVTLR
jgi:hypothetical protein